MTKGCKIILNSLSRRYNRPNRLKTINATINPKLKPFDNFLSIWNLINPQKAFRMQNTKKKRKRRKTVAYIQKMYRETTPQTTQNQTEAMKT